MLCSGAIGVLRYTCGMFIKLTRSKSRTYAQLVESFRDEQGQPRQPEFDTKMPISHFW